MAPVTYTTAEILQEANRRLARVLESPDGNEPKYSGRTFRFHRSVGLVSPPIDRRGKTLVFGDRHVREVVAIRRLQETGWDLDLVHRLFANDPPRSDAVERVAEADPGSLPTDLLERLLGLASMAENDAGRPSTTRVTESHVKSFRLARGVYLTIDSLEVAPLGFTDTQQLVGRLRQILSNLAEAVPGGHEEEGSP